MLSPTLNYSLTACSHHVKRACKTLMAQLHQNLCGVPKKGTSTSHFLAGTTLWVSHKLKTNPILFLLFSFFLLYRQQDEGESDWKTDFARFVEVCPSFFREIPRFFAEGRKPLSLEVWGCERAQHFGRWPSPFGMAMRGRCSPHSPVFIGRFPFRFQKSRPQSGDFFRLFLAVEKRFFSPPIE